MNAVPRIIEVRRGVLKKNDELAAALRSRFRAAGVFVVNVASGPGAGKTALLEQALVELADCGLRPAALVGDPETDNDARRLARSGVPVRQVRTRGVCHLDAEMVAAHLADWNLVNLDVLMIENVGNLVCTAGYDLGETLRVVLLSVTEGEDKPLKYPSLFNSADAAVLSKVDLAAACGFDPVAARANLLAVRPGLPILETSARTGAGVADWVGFLRDRRAAVLAAGG